MSRLLYLAALALVAVLLFCSSTLSGAAAVTSESGSCIFLTFPPAYTFIGGGFHMHLAVEYPIAARTTRLTFDLPKTFFIDAAEAEQLYRMEVISAESLTQGTAAVVLADITNAYTPLRMASQHFFDIEAPVFKVNYTTNHVELAFQQLEGGSGSLDAYLSADGARSKVSVRARLVIPIHSRYDVLDTAKPFFLARFVSGEDAYVRRCLEQIDVAGSADARCSAEDYASTATRAGLAERPQYQTCLELPVGLLADLPHVYNALMALLVFGAVIVILAIR